MKSSWKLPAVEHYRVLFEVGSFSGLSDGELLARFVEREADTAEIAFAALVERHGLAGMRICRSIVRNEHDAEDTFQATFLILATKAGRLRVRDSLGPWLSAVAQRVARGAGGGRLLGRLASYVPRSRSPCANRGLMAAQTCHRSCTRKWIGSPSGIGCRCCSATLKAIRTRRLPGGWGGRWGR